MEFHLFSKANSWGQLHFIWILAREEEEEEEEEGEGDEDNEEEEDDEEEDDEEDDDEEGEEKSLQTMEKQRSQGKVRGFSTRSFSTSLFSFVFYHVLCGLFSRCKSKSPQEKWSLKTRHAWTKRKKQRKNDWPSWWWRRERSISTTRSCSERSERFVRLVPFCSWFECWFSR